MALLAGGSADGAGRDDEAKEILHALMQQRGFYPMVAAQRLGEYTFRIDKAPGNASPALTQGRKWRACAS